MFSYIYVYHRIPCAKDDRVLFVVLCYMGSLAFRVEKYVYWEFDDVFHVVRTRRDNRRFGEMQGPRETFSIYYSISFKSAFPRAASEYIEADGSYVASQIHKCQYTFISRCSQHICEAIHMLCFVC